MAQARTDSYTINSGATLGAGGFIGVTQPPAPAPTAQTAQYRNCQARLFQPAAAQTYPPRVAGGVAYEADLSGPTNLYVDPRSGWRWGSPGGDWLDAARTRQGALPWFSFPANSAPLVGDGSIYRYTGVVVTALARFVQATGRPFAVRLSATAPRKVAGLATPGQLPPVVNVVYTDGTAAQLLCRLVADTSGAGLSPQTFLPSTSMPVFLEFDAPARPVLSAELDITINAHWTSATTVQGMLLWPASNVAAYTGSGGLAAAGGLYDAGLSAVPGVLGQHRYQDGSSLPDWVQLGAKTISAESEYDPALWGGASDTTKLPHVGLGKWINPPQGPGAIQLVSSGYTGDGFQPVAPGLGAMRLQMLPLTNADGTTHPADSGPLSNMKIFLPEPIYGRQQELYVRWYFRLGTPYTLTPADRKQVIAGGLVKWVDMSGKWGITPNHETWYGGVSGTSGGGRGWQMRLGFTDVDANLGGPSEGGISAGFHIVDDYQEYQPEGHRYGVFEDSGYLGSNFEERWGQQGGHGGVLYAGRWYECETRIRLNTVDMLANTWQADGVLEGWVDGKLAWRKTGMVFRTAPLHTAAYEANKIRPCRDLGITSLWLNWYHGGRTPNTVNRVVFYAALAYGTSRIGSLKRPVQALPTWRPPAGEVAELTLANGKVTNTVYSLSVPYFAASFLAKTINEYSGGTANPYYGTHGAYIYFGGGHASTNDNTVTAMVLEHSAVTFKRLTNPTPIFGDSAAVAFANSGGEQGVNNGNFGAGPRLEGATTRYTVDWQPAAVHTYQTGTIIPPHRGGAADGTYLRIWGNYAGFNGPADVNSQTAFQLALDSAAAPGAGVWEYLGTHPTAPIGQAADIARQRAPTFDIYDEVSGRIFQESRNFLPPRWFDLATKSWVQGTGAPRDQTGYETGAGCAFAITDRRIAVFMERVAGRLVIRYMDMSAAQPSWVNTPRTLTQEVNLMVGWTSACYVIHSGRIVLLGALNDTTGVYEIQVPANLNDPWPVTRASFGAGQSIPMPLVESTFGRWAYMPTVRCIVFLRQANQGTAGETVYAYTPRFT